MRIPISETIYRSGLGHAIGWRYRGAGVVLMLHSIADDPGQFLGDPLRCSVGTLEMALRWARTAGLDIVTMEEAVKRLKSSNPRRFVVFTFDDGYRDNITKALPLFEAFGAPLTIYVTTAMITRQIYAWWDALIPLIRDREVLNIEAMGREFSLEGRREKSAALSAIKHWVHQDGARAEYLRRVFAKYGVDMEMLVDRQAMTLEELKQASAHPLVTIGGHTMSHPFLTLQTDECLSQEISGNKEYLEHAIDAPVEHFSYPYGAAGLREARFVRRAGFKTAVTTRNGTAFAHHGTTEGVYEIPREAVDDIDTFACLDCRSRGVYRFLKTGGGDPIARL